MRAPGSAMHDADSSMQDADADLDDLADGMGVHMLHAAAGAAELAAAAGQLQGVEQAALAALARLPPLQLLSVLQRHVLTQRQRAQVHTLQARLHNSQQGKQGQVLQQLQQQQQTLILQEHLKMQPYRSTQPGAGKLASILPSDDQSKRGVQNAL